MQLSFNISSQRLEATLYQNGISPKKYNIDGSNSLSFENDMYINEDFIKYTLKIMYCAFLHYWGIQPL